MKANKIILLIVFISMGIAIFFGVVGAYFNDSEIVAMSVLPFGISAIFWFLKDNICKFIEETKRFWNRDVDNNA